MENGMESINMAKVNIVNIVPFSFISSIADAFQDSLHLIS